ncbi:MAG: KEOPS complex kinase/ATPase Bud32, partial [Nanoarchaeota archaeon]
NMKSSVIARGAEAIITKQGSIITKNRIEKSYRHPQLDIKIRKLRTRSEAKILEKAIKIIPTPKVIGSDETRNTIELEYIPGKKLAESLEKTNFKKVCKKIGNNLAKIHDNNIIHGDLTTSNMILNEKENKVYFIDYGLGFQSSRIEDKAVDLHLIKQALEAKHPTIYQEAFKSVIEGYKKQSKTAKQVISQLEKVERRGRYKAQY